MNHRNFLTVSISAILVLCGNTQTKAEQSDLEKLTDPALTEFMIKTSGFEVPYADIGSIIGIPLGKGQYQIVGRFNVSEKSVKDAPRNGEVVSNDGTCIIYAPYQTGFKPVKICSYKTTLTDQQISDLAYGKAEAINFFPAIDLNRALPIFQGLETIPPIRASTFNLNAEINKDLHVSTARMWLACWNIDASNDVNLGFDLPKTEGLGELAKCRSAKTTASKLEGQVRIAGEKAYLNHIQAEAEAEADKAEAEADKAEAEADKAEEDAQIWKDVLEILQRGQ